jgi:N-acetyl-alpha-D-muramate 1-phosphate uridylyltransferase
MSGESVDLDDWPIAILAGGLATRLRPVTEEIPKALIRVADQPFLAHQLQLLSRAGLRKVVLCAGYRGEMIEEEFGDGSTFGVEMSYSYDGPELLGTGGALMKALPLLGQQFLVLYGDSYLPIDYAEVVRAFIACGKSGLMTLFQNDGRWDTSNVLFSEGSIARYTKGDPSPNMRHIDYGLGVLSAVAFSSWPGGRRFDLAAIYQMLIARGELAGYEVSQRFYEIGSPSGLAELDALLRTQPLSQTR